MASRRRQSSEKKSKKKFHNYQMPNDLVVWILAKLPVKSLLRFKCLSKFCGSLMVDHDFIEQHLSNQKNKDPQILFGADIYSFSNPYRKIREIVLKSLVINRRDDNDDDHDGGGRGEEEQQEEEVDVGFEITFRFPDNQEYLYSMLQSCEGILCFFGTGSSILVFNPSIREFRFLPFEPGFYYCDVNQDCFGHQICTNNMVGFGRDQITKEFKIVRFFNNPKDDNILFTFYSECEVLTLSPDHKISWRSVDDAPKILREAPSQQPVYVNGVLYLITAYYYYMDGPMETYIISFDLHTEKFQAIQHPNWLSSDEFRTTHDSNDGDNSAAFDYLRKVALMTLRNSLCLAEQEGDSFSDMNIWIFRKDENMGAANYWEKLYYLDFESEQFYMGFPVWENKDGTLRVYHKGGHKMRVYHPKRKSFKNAPVKRHITSRFDWHVTAHFESLVPLYGEKYLDSSQMRFRDFIDISKGTSVRGDISYACGFVQLEK